MELRVVQGEVKVSEIEQIIDQPTLMVWIADLNSRHAEVFMHSIDAVILRLSPVDNAYTAADRFTAIQVGLDERWDLIAECGPFMCRIVAYRPLPGEVSLRLQRFDTAADSHSHPDE